MSGQSDLQAADAKILAAIALAVTFIQGVPAQVQAAIDATKAGDDAAAAQIAGDLNTAADALTAALPTPADPGTTQDQLDTATTAVSNATPQ